MIQEKVNSSATLDLLERVRKMKAQGLDVVSFAAGESDFPTPDVVVEAAHKAILSGETRYTNTQGILAIRDAVAKDYRNRLKATWVQPENVIVTFGAKQGIYLALASILQPGDEVLVPKPYWVSYPGIVKASSGVPVFTETQEANGFFPTVDSLEKAKTPKTKAIIFSSPNNPTGTMISKEHLQEIVSWCQKNKVYLLFDELYDRIVLGAKEHVSALSLVNEEGSEYVLSINATSKSMAMTGWRMGYTISHKNNIKSLSALQSQMVTCVPPFIQIAAAEGFKTAEDFTKPVVQAFKNRAKLISELLSKIPDLHFLKPEGAFYVFADFSKIMKKKNIQSDKDLTEALLEKAHVVMLAGSSMGMPGWIRISFACSEDEIRKGVDRIAKFVG